MANSNNKVSKEKLDLTALSFGGLVREMAEGCVQVHHYSMMGEPVDVSVPQYRAWTAHVERVEAELTRRTTGTSLAPPATRPELLVGHSAEKLAEHAQAAVFRAMTGRKVTIAAPLVLAQWTLGKVREYAALSPAWAEGGEVVVEVGGSAQPVGEYVGQVNRGGR